MNINIEDLVSQMRDGKTLEELTRQTMEDVNKAVAEVIAQASAEYEAEQANNKDDLKIDWVKHIVSDIISFLKECYDIDPDTMNELEGLYDEIDEARDEILESLDEVEKTINNISAIAKALDDIKVKPTENGFKLTGKTKKDITSKDADRILENFIRKMGF